MTPDQEQLEKQSREAVIACLQDSSVRLEFCGKDEGNVWVPEDDYNSFYSNDFYYRIAQPKPWYRVAECVNGETITACSRWDNEVQVEAMSVFKKWITERIEYGND